MTERTRRAGIAAVLALVIGGGGFAAGAATAGPATAGPGAAGPEAARSGAARSGAPSRPPVAATPRSGAGSYADVVGQMLPSVVLIRTASGLGSGVVLDGEGNIVTNAHVAGAATSFQVQLAGDSQPRHARLVGSYAPGDLAVIRAERHGGPAGMLGAGPAPARPRAAPVNVPAWARGAFAGFVLAVLASPALIAAVLAVAGMMSLRDHGHGVRGANSGPAG